MKKINFQMPNKSVLFLLYVLGSALYLTFSLLPTVVLAGSYNIFNEFNASPSAGGGGTVDPSSITTATEITIVVDANAYAGSQCGCNGWSSGADASAAIESVVDTVTIPVPAGDPLSVSAGVTLTFTKVGSDWISGGVNYGPTIDVSASAISSGNDMVGSAYAGANMYWVDPTVGTINVSSNIPGATWTITGPQTHTGSGSSAQYNNTNTGNYTIVWGNVSGYTKPTNQSLTLSNGGTITFNGTYAAMAPSCTYVLDTFPAQNDYYEVRFCNSVAPGKNACDPSPNATCGAVPFTPATLCPGGAVAGGPSSAAHGSLCRVASTQTVTPPGFSPEPGACYARRLRTTCVGAPASVDLNFVR